MGQRVGWRVGWSAALALTGIVMAGSARGSDAAPSALAPTSEQIVQRMTVCTARRADELRHYRDERHYRVEYRGFPEDLSATMTVDAIYDAPSTKRFEIVSQTGSRLLIDHVLKRLLVSEQQAALDPGETALTADNYSFRLVGRDVVAGRSSYVLEVEPKGDGKFLYRGKIWVDAQDYAVAQIEAEPAKNPSFWIKQTEIHHLYGKTGEFWLPERNRSESQMRVGGSAVLTIDYGAYQIGAAAP